MTVLDVRRNLEWAAGHVDGAVHIPLHELAGRLGEIPGGELWVHCQAGLPVGGGRLPAAGGPPRR